MFAFATPSSESASDMADTATQPVPSTSGGTGSTAPLDTAQSVWGLRARGALVILGLALLMGLTVSLSYYWITQWTGWKMDDFTKVAGIWAGLITATLTSSIGLLSTEFQAHSAINLARLNANLTQELDKVRAEHSQSLALLQRTLSEALEFSKGRMAAERKAYDELLGSTYVLFYSLKALESGSWRPDLAEAADDAMIACCRHLAAVSEEGRSAWLELWQRCRNLREQAVAKERELATEAARDQQAARRELWRNNYKVLGGGLIAFRSIAERHHLHAAAVPPTDTEPSPAPAAGAPVVTAGTEALPTPTAGVSPAVAGSSVPPVRAGGAPIPVAGAGAALTAALGTPDPTASTGAAPTPTAGVPAAAADTEAPPVPPPGPRDARPGGEVSEP